MDMMGRDSGEMGMLLSSMLVYVSMFPVSISNMPTATGTSQHSALFLMNTYDTIWIVMNIHNYPELSTTSILKLDIFQRRRGA